MFKWIRGFLSALIICTGIVGWFAAFDEYDENKKLRRTIRHLREED